MTAIWPPEKVSKRPNGPIVVNYGVGCIPITRVPVRENQIDEFNSDTLRHC